MNVYTTRTTIAIKVKQYPTEELKDWCYLNVGNVDKWYYIRRPSDGWLVFYFTNPEDATAFRLKFSV